MYWVEDTYDAKRLNVILYWNGKFMSDKIIV